MIEQTEVIMGMPVTIKIPKTINAEMTCAEVFAYFRAVDDRFSTYKKESEISRVNAGLDEAKWSDEMKLVLQLCEQTKQATNGYFDIIKDGQRDPSGLVKGWAIQNAANLLLLRGVTDFYVEAGGDIQTHGHNKQGEPWRIGIRNPFKRGEIIKTIHVSNHGIATSGTYIRGQHVYNPRRSNHPPEDVVSLTVIGPTIYDADRFATAAFAMGRNGINFIDKLPDLEGYLVDNRGIATFTHGFQEFVA